MQGSARDSLQLLINKGMQRTAGDDEETKGGEGVGRGGGLVWLSSCAELITGDAYMFVCIASHYVAAARYHAATSYDRGAACSTSHASLGGQSS